MFEQLMMSVAIQIIAALAIIVICGVIYYKQRQRTPTAATVHTDTTQAWNHVTNQKPKILCPSASFANKTFDIGKLKLIVSPVKSRIILAFRGMSNNDDEIFYQQLNQQNREAVNKILFQEWDKFKPQSIATNCGTSSHRGFHCKLEFDDKTFLKLLQQHGSNEFIDNYNQCKQIWTIQQEIKDAQNYDKDLQIYMKHFSAKKAWYPKIKKWNSSALVPNEEICQKIEFDLNDTKQTVLYLEYNTKQKSSEFKMIDYETKINKMIDDILKAVQCLMQRTKKANNKFPKSLFEWFKLDFRSYQKQQISQLTHDEKQSHINNNTMIIRVEAHLSILNYLNFVFVYKKQWLKSKKNKKLFNKWFRSYCQHIKYLKYKYTKEDKDEIFSYKLPYQKELHIAFSSNDI
eukprot:300509_1